MWRAQALEDTEPVNSFVQKTKAALCVIRRQHPAKNARWYPSSLLLSIFINFLKTTTLPIVLLYTAIAPAVRFTSTRRPARPAAPPYNAIDDSPVRPRGRFTHPHRLTWMTACSSAPAYKRHGRFIGLFSRLMHPWGILVSPRDHQFHGGLFSA